MADAAALNAFLAGVERRAFAMARLATGDREDALDLVQDAMLRLAERYGGRAPDEWPPLFFRILENGIRDRHRRRGVERRRLGTRRTGPADEDGTDPLEALPGPRATEPEAGVRTGATLDRLETALEALPHRQRQAFLLRVWEGLDVADTARAMGVSEGSVKTHYSRAVHALRDRLEGHWP